MYDVIVNNCSHSITPWFKMYVFPLITLVIGAVLGAILGGAISFWFSKKLFKHTKEYEINMLLLTKLNYLIGISDPSREHISHKELLSLYSEINTYLIKLSMNKEAQKMSKCFAAEGIGGMPGDSRALIDMQNYAKELIPQLKC